MKMPVHWVAIFWWVPCCKVIVYQQLYLWCNTNAVLFLSQVNTGSHNFEKERTVFGARAPWSNYIGPIIETIQNDDSKSYRVHVLMETLALSYNLSHAMWHKLPISSLAFDALEKHQHRVGPVEGVVVVDNASLCQTLILSPTIKKEQILWIITQTQVKLWGIWSILISIRM